MDFNDISSFNFFLWAFFGAVIGISAHLYDKRRVTGGIIATMIFGSLGAVTSGYMTSFLLGKAMITFNFEGLLLAGLGAFIIALFYRFSFRNEILKESHKERNE